jgi:hypothetical protein
LFDEKGGKDWTIYVSKYGGPFWRDNSCDGSYSDSCTNFSSLRIDRRFSLDLLCLPIPLSPATMEIDSPF